MRVGRFVAVSACSAMIALGVACSSFGTTPDAEDASSEAAPPIDAGPGVCNPAASSEAPRECATDCGVTALFANQFVDQAVLSGKTIYITKLNTVQVNTDVNAGVFTQLDDGPALKGRATKMALDDTYVYASTPAEHVRVARAGAARPKELLPLLNGDLSPVFFGTSVVYQVQPTRVIRTPKNDPDAGLSQTVASAITLAVDADDAYWIGLNSAAEPVIFGPFPALTERAKVTTPVPGFGFGFVVKDGLAYVAEASPAGTGSTISRIVLDGGTRALLVNEPGKVESLYLEDGKLYWVASARLPADGSRVLASVDRCGGPSTLLATDLPPLSPLSFDDTYAYATGKSAGAIYRMRK